MQIHLTKNIHVQCVLFNSVLLQRWEATALQKGIVQNDDDDETKIKILLGKLIGWLPATWTIILKRLNVFLFDIARSVTQYASAEFSATHIKPSPRHLPQVTKAILASYVEKSNTCAFCANASGICNTMFQRHTVRICRAFRYAYIEGLRQGTCHKSRRLFWLLM